MGLVQNMSGLAYPIPVVDMAATLVSAQNMYKGQYFMVDNPLNSEIMYCMASLIKVPASGEGTPELCGDRPLKSGD